MKTTHLDAVEESVGTFARGIVLDAPFCDLPVSLGEGLGLHAHDLLLHRASAAEQMEAGPGEQPGHGIEIGAEGFAADAGGLEGDGAAAAEGIAHARRVAEGAPAEFLDEFRKAGGGRAEVSVEFRPRLSGGADHIFRALAMSDALRFRLAQQYRPLLPVA